MVVQNGRDLAVACLILLARIPTDVDERRSDFSQAEWRTG